MSSQHCSTASNNKRPIKVENFAENVAILQSNMCEQLCAEYESVALETEYTFHAARLAVNVNKNRYKNIIPCKFNVLIINNNFFIEDVCFQMITPE